MVLESWEDIIKNVALDPDIIKDSEDFYNDIIITDISEMSEPFSI